MRVIPSHCLPSPPFALSLAIADVCNTRTHTNHNYLPESWIRLVWASDSRSSTHACTRAYTHTHAQKLTNSHTQPTLTLKAGSGFWVALRAGAGPVRMLGVTPRLGLGICD